jgi:glycosyltransferase involved in cell wall biosynthesis
MAYNEAANIARTIESILRQDASAGHVAELIVVASGCTDATVPIVSGIARSDPRVQLIVQQHREGKASAINLFLAAARSPILLMVSADVILREGAVEALLAPFRDPTVGMVGGRPIPVNDRHTFLGFTVHLLWNLHDRVAREEPKLGEVAAFRNVVPSIPADTPVDEISLQAFISKLGYRLVYEPQAVIYNRGPSTVGDFLRQRRRIYAGHLRVRQQQGYVASTMQVRRIARALLEAHSYLTPRGAMWTTGAVGLEAAARGLGYYDFLLHKPHSVWHTAVTTKARIAAGIGGEDHESVLVFRIMDYSRYEHDLGTRAAQQLVQQVMRVMKQLLGDEAVVSAKGGGITVAVVPGSRDEAEPLGCQLKEAIEATTLRCNGHRDGIAVKLSFGLIVFSPMGQPVPYSVHEAVGSHLHVSGHGTVLVYFQRRRADAALRPAWNGRKRVPSLQTRHSQHSNQWNPGQDHSRASRGHSAVLPECRSHHQPFPRRRWAEAR